MGYFLADNPHPHTPQFGYPRRGGGAPNGVCVVHTTESAIDYLGPDAGAENVSFWIATQRTGYGSYHAVADSDSIVDMAHVMWETWHDASSNPNTFGISAAVQAGLWHTIPQARRYAIYVNMAKAAAMKARECIEYGRPYPDPIHITAAQARAGVHGFVGHGEMMPETRTDPGVGFEWDVFLSAYKKEMAMGFPVSKPIVVPNPNQKEWWEMPIPQGELDKIVNGVAAAVNSYTGAVTVSNTGYKIGNTQFPSLAKVDFDTNTRVKALEAELRVTRETLVGAINAVAGGQTFDEAKLLNSIDERFAKALAKGIKLTVSQDTANGPIEPA